MRVTLRQVSKKLKCAPFEVERVVAESALKTFVGDRAAKLVVDRHLIDEKDIEVVREALIDRGLIKVSPFHETKMGWVYFIEIEGLGFVKVGHAKDPIARLRTLQTANPLPLKLLGAMPGDYVHETAMHTYMDEYRCRNGGNEWFFNSNQMSDWLARQKSPIFEPPRFISDFLHEGALLLDQLEASDVRLVKST